MPLPLKSEEQAHKVFMKFQRDLERKLADLHKKTNNAIQNIIARNTSANGYVDKAKITRIVDEYMDAELRSYRQELSRTLKAGIDDSSYYGVTAVLGAVKSNSKITADIWQGIMSKATKNTIYKTSVTDGLTLSDRIWKIADDNMYQLKRIVTSDILQGKSSAMISRDIRGFLLQPKTLRGEVKDLLRPGVGVYKSAYKNAMRVTRTETNKAYIEAQRLVAEQMGYKLQLALSGAHDVEDICDELAGNIYEPSEFPAPLHPHCMCYGITVMGEQ